MAVPDWQAPVAGQQALAGHVNQFLGTHPTVFLYQGALQAQGAAAGTVSDPASASWLAQPFTTGSSQTAVGYVVPVFSLTGNPGVPWTFSLMADAGGQPSGTALASAAVPQEFVPFTEGVTVPLPATVTPSTQYWIVAGPPSGTTGNTLGWLRSTAASGAMTSPDGAAWTAQSYGLTYQVFDQSPVPPLAGTWEDSGARWTWYGWNGGNLTGTWEFTAGQTAEGYLAKTRVLSYDGPYLTGVA